MDLTKESVAAIVAAIEARIAPLAARKAAIGQQRLALVAEERAIDRKLDRWRSGLAVANQALDLLFADEE